VLFWLTGVSLWIRRWPWGGRASRSDENERQQQL